MPRPRLDSMLMKRHSDYIRFGTGQVLVNSISQSLPVLGLALLFNMSVVGQFSMAVRVLMVPVNVVAGSLRQVVYREFTDEANRGHRFTIWRRTTLALLGVGLLPLGIIVFWGPQIFTIILGESWLEAGEYARWLSPWLLASLVNPPSTMAIPLLGLQRMHLTFEVSTALIRLATIAAGWFFGKPIIVVAGFGAIGLIANLWLIARVGITLHQKQHSPDTERSVSEVEP
jgi:lipopolysaccharide exporter